MVSDQLDAPEKSLKKYQSLYLLFFIYKIVAAKKKQKIALTISHNISNDNSVTDS